MELADKVKSIGEVIVNRSLWKPKRGLHSELHDLVDQLRTEYGETATRGVGSFSYYLGMLKPFTVSFIYGVRSQAKEARTPKKLFFWLVGQARKKVHNK